MAASQHINHNSTAVTGDYSESEQERDFDNPIYSSDPQSETDNYTIPNSPNSIYDRVMGDSPMYAGVDGSHPYVEIDNDTSVYYSTAS